MYAHEQLIKMFENLNASPEASAEESTSEPTLTA